MIVGVPTEIKSNEYRVALVPAGAAALSGRGHTVLVQAGAGLGSGFTDAMYEAAGARIVEDVDEVWADAEMIMKVKEPVGPEHGRMREGQIVYTFFHFAADEELTHAVLDSKCVAVAYETVQLPTGELPLLTPMSEVAGRLAVQEGAVRLEKENGGFGILLGGVPGVPPAEVVILGGGVVGTNAAKMAAGLGAHVTILDINLDRLRYLDDVMPANVDTVYSNRHNILEQAEKADLLIGAVLLPGARAPSLLRREDLALMKDGSVIVDVAVDQGGCIETVKPTTHADPTYVVDGVVHYCVANMPGAVPRTSTLALTNATLPYGLMLADEGWREACRANRPLALGLNAVEGRLTYAAVGEAFGLDSIPVSEVL
jgi:alanine dehydrogenase